MKIPVEYSKRSKFIIYSIGVLMILLIIVITFYQQKNNKETLANGIRTKVKIFNITCSYSRQTRSSLWFRDSKKQVHHVNVANQDCLNYKIGDSITVAYLEKEGWYILVTK